MVFPVDVVDVFATDELVVLVQELAWPEHFEDVVEWHGGRLPLHTLALLVDSRLVKAPLVVLELLYDDVPVYLFVRAFRCLLLGQPVVVVGEALCFKLKIHQVHFFEVDDESARLVSHFVNVQIKHCLVCNFGLHLDPGVV